MIWGSRLTLMGFGMFVVLTAFLVIFSLFLHELGHALYMKKYGVPIQTFSIGLPFPIALRFRSKKFLNGALIQFTPLLLGAYVQPTRYKGEDVVEMLPYKEQADIYGAGPLANFIFGLTLFLVLGVYTNITNPLIYIWSDYVRLLATIFLAILFVRPQWFTRYLMIPLGASMIVLIIWLIFQDAGKTVSGPVGIVKMIRGVSDLYNAIVISASLSISIGLFNTLPLMPLDGGRVVNALIKKHPNLQISYQIFSTVLFFMIFIFAIISDFIN